MQSKKFDFALAMSTTRCFNVAAICALAIWHGYAFYLNQAIARIPKGPSIEFKLQVTDTTAIMASRIAVRP